MSKRLSRTDSRAQTRRQLLEAAARLIGRNGYQATSVDDVVEAAGYSKGAFYYNFDSKDDLFEELVAQSIGDLVSSLEDALAGSHTIEEKLGAVQRALSEERQSRAENRLELEVLVTAVREPKVRAVVVDAYRRMRTAIASLIDEQFRDAGVKPPLPPDTLATAIIAGSKGFGLLRAIDPESVTEELLPSVVGLLLRPR